MRGYGSSLWGFPDNIFIDQYLRSRSFTDELVYFVNIKQFGRHN